jgi:hypothetical protein
MPERSALTGSAAVSGPDRGSSAERHQGCPSLMRSRSRSFADAAGAMLRLTPVEPDLCHSSRARTPVARWPGRLRVMTCGYAH